MSLHTQVRWKYSVDEYESLNTIDSRANTPTSKLGEVHTSTVIQKKTHKNNSSINSILSSSISSGSSTPPPTPQIHSIPLPEEDTPPVDEALPSQGNMLHKVIVYGSDECFSLDFSFPSAHFQANPQLLDADAAGILDAAASDPPVKSVVVDVEVDEETNFEIRIAASNSESVSVGDLIGQVQHFFRQPLSQEEATTLPTAASWIFERRVATVNGSGETGPLSRDARRSIFQREWDTGFRRVDQLLGRTRFEGFSLNFDSDRWSLHLSVPERYQQGDDEQ